MWIYGVLSVIITCARTVKGQTAAAPPGVPFGHPCYNVRCSSLNPNEVCDDYLGYPICWDPTFFPNGNPAAGCNPGLCLNGATCSSTRCICPRNIFGNNCETTTTPCIGAPCDYGNVCVTGSGGGYSCESQCADPLCVHGGTCIIMECTGPFCPPSNFRCLCLQSNTQPICAGTNQCQTDPCPTQRCVRASNPNGYRCSRSIDEDYGSPEPLFPRCIPRMFADSHPTPCEEQETCNGLTCQCMRYCKHEHGFYCINPYGFSGQNCTIEPPKVRCKLSGIEVSISQELAKQYTKNLEDFSFYISPVYLDYPARFPACEADNTEKNFLAILPFPFIRCGIVREHNFSSTIWVSSTRASKEVSLPLANFTCSFPHSKLLEISDVPLMRETISTQTGALENKLEVSFCQISTCMEDCPPDMILSQGIRLTVGETVFLTIDWMKALNYTYDASLPLRIDLRNAFLSSNPNRTLGKKLVLVKDGCEKETRFQVTSCQSYGKECFSFKMPMIRNCSGVYIHLDMAFCMEKNLYRVFCFDGVLHWKCKPSQNDSRDLRNGDMLHHVIGPIEVVDEAVGIETVAFKHDEGSLTLLPIHPTDEKEKVESTLRRGRVLPTKKLQIDLSSNDLTFYAGGLTFLLCMNLIIVFFCMGKRGQRVLSCSSYPFHQLESLRMNSRK